MHRYFECLHCGVITPVEMKTPKCGQCGHGTGVLHTKEPGKAGRKSGDPKGDSGDGPTKPEGPASMLAALQIG